MTSNKSKITRVLKTPETWVYLSSLLIALSLGLVIFGLFRGFDWTDEAWAYSLTSSGRISLGEPWAYQYLMHPILQVFGDHVLVIRFFRLISYFCLGILVSFGFGLISKSTGRTLSKTSWVILLSITQIGTVLAWSWPPRYFAYNEITSVIVQLVAVSTSVVLFTERSDSKFKLSILNFSIFWVAIGLLTGILFYGRFTGFLLLAPILFVTTFFSGKGRRIYSTILFLLALATGISAPYLFGLPLPEYLQSIWLNISDPNVQAANNHPSGLIQMYGENLWGMFLTIFPVMILFLSAVLLSSVSLFKKEILPGFSKRIGYSFLFISALISLIFVIQSGGGAERTGKIAIVSFAIAGILIFIFSTPINSENYTAPTKAADYWRIIGSVALISIAPIIASFGTNNPLTIHFGFDSTIWLGAAGYGISLWFTASKVNKNQPWLPLFSILLLAIFSCIAILGEARGPYRSASFKANSEFVSAPGPLQGLFVTPAEKSWLNWIQEQSLKLDAQNVPTLSLKSAGALLAFNNSSFASPWLESFWPASFWSVSKACQSGAPKDLIVLVPGTVPEGASEWNDLGSTLEKSCHIAFPADFQKVANYEDDDPLYAMTIWRLKTSY